LHSGLFWVIFQAGLDSRPIGISFKAMISKTVFWSMLAMLAFYIVYIFRIPVLPAFH